MATDLYLDSSALAKLYVREPETVELSAFVRQYAPPLPFSSLHELELTHAIERRREEGDLTTIQLNQITAALDKDLTTGVLARRQSIPLAEQIDLPSQICLPLTVYRRQGEAWLRPVASRKRMENGQSCLDA